MRIAIIGSCQVAGLAAAARSLLPDAHVKSWHIGVWPKASDEDIVESTSSWDLLISQIPDAHEHEALRISRLRELGLPVVFLPIFTFGGFHPDATYIMNGNRIVRGAMSDYHSIIVAASFALGVPEERVPALFNTYIFSELGYFGVFEMEKAELLAKWNRQGFDIQPLVDKWIADLGQFMHTINHPHIRVLWDICRLVLMRAGHVATSVAMPQQIHDDLAESFVWPAYPPIANHQRCSRSISFIRGTQGLPHGQTRSVSLVQFVSASYRAYETIGRAALSVGPVETAKERLRRVIVL